MQLTWLPRLLQRNIIALSITWWDLDNTSLEDSCLQYCVYQLSWIFSFFFTEKDWGEHYSLSTYTTTNVLDRYICC